MPEHLTRLQDSTPERDDDIAAAGDGVFRSGQSPFVSGGGGLPTATLVVYRNRITITRKGPQPVIEIPRESVLAIQHSVLGGEIQIVHNMAELPPYVGFAGGYGTTIFILEGLDRFGYPIAQGKTPTPGRVTSKLSWKPIAAPLVAAGWALVLAFLYRNRLLPSLSQPRILSAGKEVPTGEFANFMAQRFTIGAIIFLLVALAILAWQLWAIRQQRAAK